MSKLAERMKEHDIPPIPYLPMGSKVLIYRLPPVEKTAGGLYIPGTEQSDRHMGVLVAAGLGALDALADHLTEVGDLVWFGKYAGSELDVKRDGGNTSKKMVQCMVEDINGSVDAVERAQMHEIVREESTGEHFYRPRKSGRKAA